MITANQLGWLIKVVGEDYMANTIFSSPTMAMRFLVAVEADDLVYSLELHDLTSFPTAQIGELVVKKPRLGFEIIL